MILLIPKIHLHYFKKFLLMLVRAASVYNLFAMLFFNFAPAMIASATIGNLLFDYRSTDEAPICSPDLRYF